MYVTKTKTDENISSANRQAGRRPFFQTKLSVNTPGDIYEQEADAMADKVMRMAIPPSQNFFKPSAGLIHRKCKECEDDTKMLHRKEGPSAQAAQGRNNLGGYINSLSSSGQPLPAASRQFFEPRFGRDFSNVRVHTDSVAAKSAQSINALAYTAGSNIIFNSGQFSPENQQGKKLMAHELTHVVQQGGATTAGNSVQRARLPCVSGKTIDVFGIELPGATRSLADDVKAANGILCQCGIEINNTGGQSWQTDLMDKENPKGALNEFSGPGNPTSEETEMLNYTPGGSAIHVYYVPSLSNGSRGESFSKKSFPTVKNNAVVISNSAAVDTFAHELTHVLTNEGAHSADPKNLMASGKARNVGVDELTQGQCDKM
jgi:hypothetical protein